MNALEVIKNKIVTSDGKEVILKGACIIDPALVQFRDKHESFQDIGKIKKLGFNTIKVVISPSMWLAREKDYAKIFLDPIVKLCKELDLYCWLDWHAHGNPVTNETRSSNLLDEGFMRYDARKETAEKTLYSLAKRYLKEKHIIIELFANPLVPSWGEWRTLAQEWVNEIRKYTEAIISISAIKWISDLSGVIKDPVEGKNIVYGAALYPKFEIDKKALLKVKSKYPVVITECGFIEASSDEGGIFEGDKNYAEELKDFTDSNKLSWMAWVYHPFGLTSKAPVLINSWNPGDLSEWGKFVKEKLLR